MNINDTRQQKDFGKITFSKYKKNAVIKELIQCVLKNKLESAYNWSAELIPTLLISAAPSTGGAVIFSAFSSFHIRSFSAISSALIPKKRFIANLFEICGI